MTTVPLPARPQPALRPLALPIEHGGWGFLLEPIALGLLIAPSWGGALLSVAAVFAFLARQPLKLALQDALREKSYPRTPYCWMFASAYLLAAAVGLTASVAIAGPAMLIPLGLVAPLALTQVLYDAHNRGRALLPELSGAASMASVAAAIAIAGRMRIVPAFAVAGILVARSLPAIVYVRTLLQRAHGNAAASWPAIAMHALAVIAIASFAPRFATAAMVVLLIRAIWGLTHEPPRAKTLGWREIAWGAITVGLAALGYA